MRRKTRNHHIGPEGADDADDVAEHLLSPPELQGFLGTLREPKIDGAREKLPAAINPPGREQFHYLESWLLPTLGLRVNVFHFNPGFERDQDHYLDVGEITVGAERWETRDHYLDLVVKTGQRTDLMDVDELLEAHREGLVSTETAESALTTAVATVSALAACGHDLAAWLAAAGMELRWRQG